MDSQEPELGITRRDGNRNRRDCAARDTLSSRPDAYTLTRRESSFRGET